MSFHWGEHVGELELRIAAADEEGVMAAALAAVGELLGEGDGDHEADAGGDPLAGGEAAGTGPGAGTSTTASRWRTVEAAGADRAALLAAWLEELLYLGESEGFVSVEATDVTMGDGLIRARVRGYSGAPRHLVKAVTYHRLTFDRTGQGWEATAVLDV